ncbi:mitochondrial ribosomal protein subunit S4 [Gamsiella multidivaricata]|uniref:mitochondrial ribosomal protein subunit S4 n=1 Tax=Gamsiella multidivaricata TaxID=101098 RepID=UPI00221F770D|nr:mitochondrial ribosomal protein subunit S4 [Gamsiella multidivaricata]KAI7817797.1 mitochondrial ribosomal protein subunit S4 [Gamsiella multidivaricata]
MSDVSSSFSESARHRQSKKDEAIRRKIEQELSKKRHSSRKAKQTQKVMAGTVSALRVSQALTVSESITVTEASQNMAAKRADCVLVINDEEHLSGIFTAKDLAFRVVAAGLDPRSTRVADIMTPNPMVVTTDRSATDALNLMVQKGFRHLANSEIVGLLDITKCLYESLSKMERAYGQSKKLYDALEGVDKEWGGMQNVAMVQYMETLREKMMCPDLSSVLDGSPAAEVSVKATVKEAAKLMKERRVTAVLVMDQNGIDIAGIFTSKDIVLRVIAAQLEPSNCSVVRVMTPHPDTAPSSMTIMDALRKMHDGHYLNLPVVEEDKEIVGVVDVLKLTYATMEQINSMNSKDSESGPMWNHFWNSAAMADGDEGSVVSESMAASSIMSPSLAASPSSHQAMQPFPGEIFPNESASVVAEDRSELIHKQIEEESTTFVFKFKSPISNTVHRFTADFTDLSRLRETIMEKEPFGPESDPSQSALLAEFNISYLDDEQDYVMMTSDADLADSVAIAKKQGQNRVMLFVADPRASQVLPPSSATLSTVSAPAPVTAPASVVPEEQIRSPVEQTPKAVAPVEPKKAPSELKKMLESIPEEYLLPGALVTLSVTIIAVFAIARLAK